jgi:hypothetical protein
MKIKHIMKKLIKDKTYNDKRYETTVVLLYYVLISIYLNAVVGKVTVIKLLRYVTSYFFK